MPKANKENVKLTRPTRISGGQHERGDSVAVYPFQKRHLVDGGYAEGSVEDIVSDGERDAGVLNVFKKADERDDIEVWSVQKAFEENDPLHGDKAAKSRK